MGILLSMCWGVELITDSKENESPSGGTSYHGHRYFGRGAEVSTVLPTTTMYWNHLWTWRLHWETRPFDRLRSGKLACTNSPLMLYFELKVSGQFRSNVLLHFWPGRCKCGACVSRGVCRFQVAGTDGRFPAMIVSKGLRTLKLSACK